MSRERNRQREHADHGWFLADDALIQSNSEVFVRCPCGWFGWLPKKFWENQNKK